jgi:dipeptidyl aminopeptidase/acylaminoacyl peptidase
MTQEGRDKIRRTLGPALLAIALAWGGAGQAQSGDRTIEEIKLETQARAERGAYPLIGLDPADVSKALAAIRTRDPDEWAAAWSAVAESYMDRALVMSSHAQADAAYVRAWRLYYFAQWPVPSSDGKRQAYAKALDAYLKHAGYADPPIEVVRIPFEGSEIVGYLRLPRERNGPVPMVLAISGLDSRKETVAETFAAILPQGAGFFAVDGPGTGQAPLKVSETADRMFSRVLDYLATRPEVDKSRIAVFGVSFGGYWAAKLAHTERSRLRGVVAQSPAVHDFFQPDYLAKRLLGNREYLFDQVPALVAVFDGAAGADDLARIFPKMSLVSQGLVGQPTAPMLIVGGVKDTQVPISDLDRLLHAGAPKEAWINPQGGHLGREATGWTDPVIFRRVMMPWLVRVLTRSEGN